MTVIETKIPIVTVIHPQVRTTTTTTNASSTLTTQLYNNLRDIISIFENKRKDHVFIEPIRALQLCKSLPNNTVDDSSNNNNNNNNNNDIEMMIEPNMDMTGDDHNIYYHNNNSIIQQQQQQQQQQHEPKLLLLPQQIRDHMTINEYNTFVTQINEYIHQYDIATTKRYLYEVIYMKRILILTTPCITFIILLMQNKVFPTLADDTPIIYLILYSFLIGCFIVAIPFIVFMIIIHKLYYPYYSNDRIVQQIHIQNQYYDMICRECERISNDILSTTSVVTTLHLGYTPPPPRPEVVSSNNNDNNNYQSLLNQDKYYQLYYDTTSKQYIQTIRFDHIVMTSTTLPPQE